MWTLILVGSGAYQGPPNTLMLGGISAGLPYMLIVLISFDVSRFVTFSCHVILYYNGDGDGSIL